MSGSPVRAQPILIGSALIALALLIGAERIRGAILTRSPLPNSSTAPERLTRPDLAVPPADPAAGPSPSESKESLLADQKLRLRDKAQASLAERAPLYSKACGSVPRASLLEPAFSTYRVTVQFDAAGHERARDFATGTPHKARDACVRDLKDEPLAVGPLEAAMSVELSLDVP